MVHQLGSSIKNPKCIKYNKYFKAVNMQYLNLFQASFTWDGWKQQNNIQYIK